MCSWPVIVNRSSRSLGVDCALLSFFFFLLYCSFRIVQLSLLPPASFSEEFSLLLWTSLVEQYVAVGHGYTRQLNNNEREENQRWRAEQQSLKLPFNHLFNRTRWSTESHQDFDREDWLKSTCWPALLTVRYTKKWDSHIGTTFVLNLHFVSYSKNTRTRASEQQVYCFSEAEAALFAFYHQFTIFPRSLALCVCFFNPQV